MTDKKRLERVAIKAFRQHWSKIVRELEEGKNTFAEKLYRCFEADTSTRQKILANRFYGLDHARKMAALSETSIKRRLSCYLPKAVEYALSSWLYVDEPKEQEAFMKRLVSSEYVIFRSDQHSPFEFFDENDDELWVSEYPAEAAYDDWYEGSIGAENICQTFVLMKSTGEAFSKTEINWLKGAIMRNIDGNDHSAFWWFACEPLARNKLWIKIYDFKIDKDLYVDEFLAETHTLSKDQFREFVRQILEYLHKEGENKIKRKLSVFKNYELLEKQDLSVITEKFLLTNWEAGILSDFDIRTAEDIMNRIRGRKDRDYHSGIN